MKAAQNTVCQISPSTNKISKVESLYQSGNSVISTFVKATYYGNLGIFSCHVQKL